MKKLILTLVASFVFSAFGSPKAAMADEAKSIFQYYNGSMLGGEALRLSILDNGDIHAYRGRAIYPPQPKFDAVVDRLDERTLERVKAALNQLKPGMKLRELTARETRILKGCAMDSSVNYVALGSQYEYGRLVVWRAQGCGINTGLADPNVEHAMKGLREILDKALREHHDKIYR